MTHLPQSYRRLPDRLVKAIRQRVQATLLSLVPELAPDADRALERLVVDQWPLEWSLPWWLGRHLQLPQAEWLALTLTNVLGMVHVRLQDDLADEAHEPEQRGRKLALSGACFQQAQAQLSRLLGNHPQFWDHQDRYLAQWLRAGLHSRPAQEGEGPGGHGDSNWLAWRGAPLKITATGACLLAERPDLVAPLEETLDRLNLATVLLDHADDWATDLPAGRFNAFVAHASPLAQTPPHREENERRVMRLFLLGDAGRAYYGEVGEALRAAERAGLPVSCPDLTGYIRHFQLEVERLAEERAAQGRAALRQATEQLLGPRSADWPPEGDP